MLFKNTALLTTSALVMRTLGMLWQVWLTRRIGAVGIGLFGLVMNVGFLFITVAVSGIRFAVTRLIAEETGAGHLGSAGPVVRRAAVYCLFFGISAGAILWLCAGPIGRFWIGDVRAIPSLRLLALSLPAGGISSLLSGYFTAVGRVWKTAAEQFFEQLGRMALTALFLTQTRADGLAAVCAAVVGAGAVADNLGAAAMGTLYYFDRRRYRQLGAVGNSLTPRMLRIALPLAVSAWARSALGTFRQLLVPKGLRLSGMGSDAAMAGYGVIHGMALPLLTFPTCLPAALAELLVPALTEAQVSGQTIRLRRTVARLLGRTIFFSAAAGAVFFAAADLLGGLLFGSREAARWIRLLAPMTLFLYTDIVTDGCLKGLGQMMRSMVYNVAEAALGLGLVWALLPRWALGGYLFVLYTCEIFNFTLSIRRLQAVTGFRWRELSLFC